MAHKPGFYTVRGLHPSGKSLRDFWISQGQVRHFQQYGPEHKFFDSLIIPYVLTHPAVIFQGLERENMEDGLCYAGCPIVRYINADITVPPHPGMIFAVFVDGKFRVFDWRWEKADANNNGYPMDAKKRFRKKIWSV